MIAPFIIKFLRRIDPETRLGVAAHAFIWSIVLGIFSCAFLCDDWFQRILMAISWLAITITALDVILTADVRAEQDGE